MHKKVIGLLLIFIIILNLLIPGFAFALELEKDGFFTGIVINKPGTIIKNKKVNNLHITREVRNGYVTLSEVIVSGELKVDGGGENSIILKDSIINHLTANKQDGKVGILAEGDTSIKFTSVKSDILIKQKQLTGSGFENLTLDLNSSVQIEKNKDSTLKSSDESLAKVSKDGLITVEDSEKSAAILESKGNKEKEIFKIDVNNPSNKTIKILSIGNSFSQDTVYYLYDLAQSAGINLLVGNLYKSGCSLEKHWNYAKNNEKVYDYYKWASNEMTTNEKQTMKDVLLDQEWDYITFQQSSADSGKYSTFQPYLNDLLAYTKSLALNPNVKFALNMTWAYASQNLNEGYALYGYNQNIMYNSILDAYIKAANETKISMIIPSGTAIQNARTNKNLRAFGNDLTSDGYHLDTVMGRYIAALTIFETLINEENIEKDIFKDVEFVPNLPATRVKKDNKDQLIKLAKQAVLKAVESPFEITKLQ